MLFLDLFMGDVFSAPSTKFLELDFSLNQFFVFPAPIIDAFAF